MVSALLLAWNYIYSRVLVNQDDHITSGLILIGIGYPDVDTMIPAEPLRRGDLLNAINKFAGDKRAKHPLLHRPATMS
jgi:hypothetical protein